MELRDFKALIFSGSLAIAWPLAGAPPSNAEEPSESTSPEVHGSQPQEPESSVPELSNYSRILIHPVGLAYTIEFSKDAGKQRKKIESDDLARIQRYFVEALEEKVAGSYAIATEPAPDVLRVDAVLVDAIVDKSAWLAPARDSFKTRDKMFLVALLRDSKTGVVVHRVVVDARPFGNVVFRQSPLVYWEDMRFLLKLLATRVHWVLEKEPHSSAIAAIVAAAS
jgi:hypothetical protein